MFCYNRANNAVTRMGGCFDPCMARDCMQDETYLKNISRDNSELDSHEYDTANQDDMLRNYDSDSESLDDFHIVTFGESSNDGKQSIRKGDFIYRSQRSNHKSKVRAPISSYNFDDLNDQDTEKFSSKQENYEDENHLKSKCILKAHKKTYSYQENTPNSPLIVPLIQKSKSEEPSLIHKLVPVIEENELKSFDSATDQWLGEDQNQEDKTTLDDVVIQNDIQEDIPIQIPPPPASNPQLFSAKRFTCLLKAILKGAETERMDINHYTDLYFESLKLFKFLGSAVALGFKDVKDKANGILANQKLHLEQNQFAKGAPEITYIEQLMLYEVQSKLSFMNQGNNKTILKKEFAQEDIKNWMYSYQSVGWIVIRGAWFFDFMAEIIHLLVSDRKIELIKASNIAYDTKLGPHHPWILRKLVKVAFNAVTTRDNFLKSYIAEKKVVEGDQINDDVEQIYDELTEFYVLCEKLAAHIWSFSKKNGIDQIP